MQHNFTRTTGKKEILKTDDERNIYLMLVMWRSSQKSEGDEKCPDKRRRPELKQGGFLEDVTGSD